jgi:phosphatidylserine/phosphatidylglycerophosphate/cardiolipin synthase-like enzyme
LGGVLLLVIALAVINYCSPKPDGPGGDSGSTPQGMPAWLTVYFTDPEPPDNVGHGVDQYIVPLLDGATQTIDLTSYDLNLPSVLDALVSASGRGVRVRVVYDGENGETELDADKSPTGEDINAVTMLKSAGIPLVDGGRSNGLMHNKMIIVDGKTLVMGSWNMSYNDTYRNNNNVLVITDPTLIANYQAKFDEGFEAKQFGAQAEVGARTQFLTAGGVRVANYFSPPDGVMEKLVGVVGGAQSSIRFMAFTYTHRDLADAMIARHDAGVDVRGIFESRASTQGAMVPLYCAGVPVKVDGNGYTIHHKVNIIDDHIVIWLFNFTVSADDPNDDNLLVIDRPWRTLSAGVPATPIEAKHPTPPAIISMPKQRSASNK